MKSQKSADRIGQNIGGFVRSRGFRFVLAVAVLICLDQVSKLLVRAFTSESSLNALIYTQSSEGWFMFHIHPELHDRYSLPADIVIAVLAAVFTAAFIVYHKYERAALLRDIPDADSVKSSPRLTEAALILWTAGIICSTLLDAFIWGGSLDYICIEWAKFYTDAAETYTVSHQINVDPKDIFLIVGTALILLRSAIFGISKNKLPKSSRKLISKRSLHFIKSMREASGNISGDEGDEDASDGKEKIKKFLDIPALILFDLIFSICLGYILYTVTVLLIIPLLVEFIPGIGEFLTKISEGRDSEDIYAFIRSLCQLIGVFPGATFANCSLKNRERSFIHDTSGMILKRDGLKYHIRRYLLYDAVSVLCITAIGFSLCFVNPWRISPFIILYEHFGIPLGILISAVLVAAAQLFGIILAQNRWRAEYFCGE